MIGEPAVEAFWARFLASVAAKRLVAPPKLFEAFAVGATPEQADAGAALILAGEKTATSAHASEFDPAQGPPTPGALSILLDGAGRPVAVVETVEIKARTLDQLDADFALDYGEWDRTLPTLRRELATWHADKPKPLTLLCERFRVVYRE